MSRITINQIRKISYIAGFIYLLLYYCIIADIGGLQSNILPTVVADQMDVIGEFLVLVIMLQGVFWQEKAHKAEWILFLAGTAWNLLGDVSWNLYESYFNREVPVPSVCDVIYLAGAICYLTALFFYIRKESLFDIVRSGFDIAITMVACSTIIIKYLMLPIWQNENLSFLGKLATLAYPVMDLGYMAGLLSILFLCSQRSRLNRSAKLLCAGFLVLFAADMIYALQAGNTYVSGGYLDPLWPAGYWIIGLASLYPTYQEKKVNEDLWMKENKSQIIKYYFRFLLPYIGTGLIILLASYRYITKDPLIAGSVLTALLIMIRQIFSLLENKKLIAMIQKTNLLLEESKTNLEIQNQKLQQVNELKEKEANIDFLTGLFNRRFINNRLRNFRKNVKDQESFEISVLLIDIDHYKKVNDQGGHDTGDMVLKEIAELIRKSVRGGDIAGRYGGDEFIVILPRTDIETAAAIAGRLVKKTAEKEFSKENSLLNVTLSIGCSHWKGPIVDYKGETLITVADQALYEAKENGRNQYIRKEVNCMN